MEYVLNNMVDIKLLLGIREDGVYNWLYLRIVICYKDKGVRDACLSFKLLYTIKEELKRLLFLIINKVKYRREGSVTAS